MYIYEGKNPDSGETIRKEFEDEYEAINFARVNAYDYPIYVVKDEDDEIVDSNEMADDQMEVARDNMFPDEDSEEGYDFGKRYEED